MTGIVKFIREMMDLVKNSEENVPPPNNRSRLFVTVRFILARCFNCRFSKKDNESILNDRGWPIKRLFHEEEGIFFYIEKEFRVTILEDESFSYLYVYCPAAKTSYKILDITPNLSLFESSEIDEAEAELSFESSPVKYMAKLRDLIGSKIIEELGKGDILPKHDANMILLNFELPTEPNTKKKRTTETSSLFSEILKLVPDDSNSGSKLLGSIIFMAQDMYSCKFKSAGSKWPITSQYSGQVIDFDYKDRVWSFSLLNYQSDFFLSVWNADFNLVTVKKIPELVTPSFAETDKSDDDVRISAVASWLNDLFSSVIDKDLKRSIRRAELRSPRSSASSSLS